MFRCRYLKSIMTRFFLKFTFAFAVIAVVCLHSFAQKTHVIASPFSSALIAVNSFNWNFDTTANSAAATVDINNKGEVEILSVSIALVAKNKQGIMLQSGQMRTIKTGTKEVHIPSKATSRVIFEKAFNNQQIDTIILKQVTVQFANGSVEILK